MTAPVRRWINGSVAVGLLAASTVMPAVAAGLAYYSNPQAGMQGSTAAVPMQFMSGEATQAGN